MNWPGISWALFILVLSTVTPPAVKIPDLFDLFAPDKIVHFVFYAVFVILFSRGFIRMPPGSFWSRNFLSIPFIGGVTYGGLIELYQGFLLTGRIADWTDFLANCIGSAVGWLILKIGLSAKLITR